MSPVRVPYCVLPEVSIPGIQGRYWGRYLWARGYCVSMVGLDEEKIRKYVQWQEQQERQAEVVQGELFK